MAQIARQNEMLSVRLPNRYSNQGCGDGVEAGVGVDQSQPFCLESESGSELESEKMSTPTPARSCRIPPVNRQLFGPIGYDHPENIKRQEEKECQCGNVIKLRRHSMIEFRLIDKGYWK